MKKITLTLLAAVLSIGSAFSQANLIIQAPQYDGSWSTLHAPSGSLSAVNHRACYLITQSELTGLLLTNSVVTGFGFDFLNGVNAPVTGQFTVYLQNTSDASYLKGTSWPTAILPMSTNFVGNYPIPVSTGTAEIVLPLTTNFNYTGGGIYVAFDWNCPTANATTPARYYCNTTGLTPNGGSYTFTAAGPAPTTMSLDVFRPAFVLKAANTATNEISVENIQAYGKYSKLLGGQQVTADVMNRGNAAKTNVAVTLTVGGANPFSDVVTVPNIGAGAITTVTFATYNTPNMGLSNMSVTVPNDQDNTNNLWVWSQSVTCNDYAYVPPLAASVYTDVQYGLNPSGVYAYRFNPSSSCNLKGINMVVSNNAAGLNNQIAGVVVDLAGTILATTNTITISAAMYQTWQNFTFTTPFALTAGTDYYIGVAQNVGSASYYPFSSLTPGYPVQNFYRGNPIGTAMVNVDRGYLAIGAVLDFTNTVITATSSKSVVCKSSPLTVTLSATGADSYTWSSGLGNGNTVTLTPTANGASTATQVSVIGSYTTGAANGCKSNSASLTFTLLACNGLANTTANDAVKLFPNPTVSGKTTVTGLVGENTITVYNTLGQVVSSQITSEETANIDISTYPVGNYLVKITDSSRESRIIKIVNQN